MDYDGHRRQTQFSLLSDRLPQQLHRDDTSHDAESRVQRDFLAKYYTRIRDINV